MHLLLEQLFRRKRSSSVLGGFPLWLCVVTVVAAGCNVVLHAEDYSAFTTEQIFRELKALPQEQGLRNRYYDMHGNADPRLQELMIRRFSVTKKICSEIDASSIKLHPAYIACLYRTLAVIKDPASIPWLEGVLKSPRAREVYDHWLLRWRTYLRGAATTQLKWLAEPEKWSEFYRRWADAEEDQTKRLAVLGALQGWLHDADTQQFFAKLERSGRASGEELLLTQLYLRQHGKPFDQAKLRDAIAELSRTRDGQRILLKYAGAIRDEAFVPWLIEVADDSMKAEFMTPQRALEAITFQRDIKGSSSWKEWFDANGKQGRTQWMAHAGSRINSLAATNVLAAKQVLEKAIYAWDDPGMLPHMQRLALFKPLHSGIAGWINLTYHEVPFLRGRLRPLAVTIRDESENELQEWAKNLMQDWDFLQEDGTTWEQYVRMSNMRV